MALAGLVRSGEDRAESESAREEAKDALARLALAERDREGLQASLDKARKANALLLGIRNALEEKIKALERPAPADSRAKPGRKPKMYGDAQILHEEMEEIPDALSDWG
jgi:uncharacterized protein YhaN